MNSHPVRSLVLFLLIALTARAQELSPNAPQDKPVSATSETIGAFEKALAPHIEKARKTYPEARGRFLAGLPARHHFYVTTRIKDPNGVFEQVFISVLSIDQEKKAVTGRIANELSSVRTYSRGQTISFPETEVLDWTITRPDGSEEGNYVGKFIDEFQARMR